MANTDGLGFDVSGTVTPVTVTTNGDAVTTGDSYASVNPKGFRAHDNHVIVVIGEIKKQYGSLVLPKGINPEPGTGVVISVGYGVERVKVGNKITWKDSVTFMNDKMVTNDSSVFLDSEKRLVAVRKDMIIAVRDA